MDESVTDRLINVDISGMSGPELLAHLDAVEQHMRRLRRTELALLERSPEIVAQRPELQAQLDHLRSLDLEDLPLDDPPSPT
ncbi:hypothetical protein AB0L64_11525 [Kribbella sp. NPDC051936]|uniref:hypothetical protein n=1 Tax=Kribbella sp. NPDC051936 TaxID=3154946 RepID=UPI00341B87E5